MTKKIDMPAPGQPCALVSDEGVLFFNQDHTDLVHKTLGADGLSFLVNAWGTRCIVSQEVMDQFEEWREAQVKRWGQQSSNGDRHELSEFLAPPMERKRGVRGRYRLKVSTDRTLHILGDAPNQMPCDRCPEDLRYACHARGGSPFMWKDYARSQDECRILAASQAVPVIDVAKLKAAGFWVTTSVMACQQHMVTHNLAEAGEAFDVISLLVKAMESHEFSRWGFERDIIDPISSGSYQYSYDNIDMTTTSLRGRALTKHVKRQLKQFDANEQQAFEERECSKCVMGGPKQCGGRTAQAAGTTCAVTREDIEQRWQKAVSRRGSDDAVKDRMARWSLAGQHVQPYRLGLRGTIPFVLSGWRDDSENAIFRKLSAPFAMKCIANEKTLQALESDRHRLVADSVSWERERLDGLTPEKLREQYWSMVMVVSRVLPRYGGFEKRMRYSRDDSWHKNQILYVKPTVREVSIGCDTMTNQDGGRFTRGGRPLAPSQRPRYVVHIDTSTIGGCRRHIIERIGGANVWETDLDL